MEDVIIDGWRESGTDHWFTGGNRGEVFVLDFFCLEYLVLVARRSGDCVCGLISVNPQKTSLPGVSIAVLLLRKNGQSNRSPATRVYERSKSREFIKIFGDFRLHQLISISIVSSLPCTMRLKFDWELLNLYIEGFVKFFHRLLTTKKTFLCRLVSHTKASL